MVAAMGGNLETLIKKPKPYPATDGLGARQVRMGTEECGKAKCDLRRGGLGLGIVGSVHLLERSPTGGVFTWASL